MARSATTHARRTDALLREVSRLFAQAQHSLCACCPGATGKECEALTLLGRTGPINIQEFARRMDLEKTWASRLAARLVRRGLVRQAPNPEDGRSRLLELTAKGAASCRTLDLALDEHAAGLLAAVPAAERAGVERALAFVRDALATQVNAKRSDSSCSC